MLPSTKNLLNRFALKSSPTPLNTIPAKLFSVRRIPFMVTNYCTAATEGRAFIRSKSNPSRLRTEELYDALDRVDLMLTSPPKSPRLCLIAFLEPSPVEIVMSETIIPSATDSLPMKIITRERLFLLSLEFAIFLEK